jgi:glycine/D-amino acid oxidase-like deaminating enzyme
MSDSSANVTVVVIGGGAMCASTAYQLAGAGVTGVVLLEANELASGSSGKPLGGVRGPALGPGQHRARGASLQAFHRFHDDFGVDIGSNHRVGYLFLLREAADVSRYRASIELQNSLGVDSRRLRRRGVWVPRTVSRVLTSGFAVAQVRRPPPRPISMIGSMWPSDSPTSCSDAY